MTETFQKFESTLTTQEKSEIIGQEKRKRKKQKKEQSLKIFIDTASSMEILKRFQQLWLSLQAFSEAEENIQKPES